MKLVKRQKIVIAFVVVALLLGSILAVTYGNLSHSQSTGTFSQLPQLQVFSPQENGTYQTINVPLNITSNNATAKITYSLDGAENVTLAENITATPSLTKGIHYLSVFALDSKGEVGDCKNFTFYVDIPYPPNTKLTAQQLQETIAYFKSRGVTLEVYTNDNSSWHIIPVWLNMGVVDLESREALATFANEHNVSELKVYIDATYASFNAYVYDNSSLPVIYSFSATIV